ncbi:cupin [Burkholderia cepacia]|uniref:cupin domain-containing protein n=2 Tax=Burkholderia cepacia TaxID=292 RepID=UPI0007569871|nr:cupin domain-containing protein [Burkholderia cepacia]KVA50646.1 cupin [Burkholderia cepacia]KVA54453.1 cupin [Burkholderia cepacia]KVA63475.1 cupin [Burkholderia cepacia]KVA82058.1 cupin [Burkholderia cepacia]KVA90789.1 cupin [Burkholderia cepacia]
MNARAWLLVAHPPRVAGRPAMLAALAAAVLTLGPAAPRSAVDWLTDICGGGGDRLLSAASPNADAMNRPPSTVKVLSCEPLPNVPGKSVTTAIVDFPPLGFTPAHRHPGSVVAVVLEGTIRSQLEGGAPVDYASGQTWFEPPRALHLFAENPDPTRPARLLATFVADTGCGALVLPPD